jgi:hypothetical protein
MRRPYWRKMTWAILVWSALMGAWIIRAISSANPAQNCVRHAHMYLHSCGTFSTAGMGIAILVLVSLWFFGFCILSLIWLMSKPRRRLCPACGEKVKRGFTICPSCQHDFAATTAVA